MSDGTNIEKIDLEKVDWRGSREFFESLGETLDRLDDKDESFDFTWVGKRKSVIEAGAPINKTFRPDVDSSKNWNTTENLFIEGDNLDALKLLQESYLGKVKMIYIDPPYNTGKDFVYHDNFKASVENYDEDTDYKDESGNIQFKKNEKSNGRYHSDWLNMMYPRLKLARNLLTEDGVIFISIDDNEQANLKKLCDEIFGEDNLVGTFIWKKKGTSTNVAGAQLSSLTEYVLCFARNSQTLPLNSRVVLSSERGYPFEDSEGNYRTTGLEKKSTGDYNRESMKFEIIGHTPRSGKRWQIGIEKARELESKNRFIFDNGIVKLKIYDFEDMDSYSANPNLLLDIGSTQSGQAELDSLMKGTYFDTPKPVGLVKHLMSIGSKKDSVVLDFFSGSATTSHAVMQLNAEDGGSRKWIMVQLSEETDEKSEAFKAGYKTIPEISRERIRRAGDKIAGENPDVKGDYGFRSLVIADTNYKEVYKSAGEQQQSTLLDVVNNIKDDRSEFDLLYGVLTQSALELNRPFESKDLGGSNVFLYDYFGAVSGLVACFSDSVPEETIKEIAKLKPLTAVFKDSSFASSQDKVNLAEHFRIISPDTKVKVI